ncbi:hypothetical protein ES703_22724 [subsurface metagenome]
MKLIVHVTKDNLTAQEAEDLYEEIKGELIKDPTLHVNGQIVDKFIGSHETGHAGPPGEI